MRNILRIALLIAASSCLVAALPGVDVTGTWTGDLKGQDGRIGKVRLVLRQEGAQISGTVGPIDKQNPGHIYDAKLEGDHLVFAADDTDDEHGLKLTYNFDLTVANGRMQGKAHGRSGDRSWTLEISATRDR